jgi:hypothetical protein
MGTRSGKAFAAKGSQGSGSSQSAVQGNSDKVVKNGAAGAATNGSKKRRKLEVPDSTAESQSQEAVKDQQAVKQAQGEVMGEVVAETQDVEDLEYNEQGPDIEMVDEDDTQQEQAPPSSQPRPVEDEEDDEIVDSKSLSSFEGAYSYSDLNDDSSSGDESEADVDLELIEAEARRRLLAEDVGDEDELSDTESERETASTALKIPVEQDAKRVRKNAQAKAVAKPPKVALTESLSAEIESFARSHSVWKVAETAKEFNKILFPFLREAQHLSQADSLKVLTALRERWTEERSRSGQQEAVEAKPLEQQAGKSAVDKQKRPGARDGSATKKAKVSKKEKGDALADSKVQEKSNGVGESESSTQKRKRRNTQEESNTQEHHGSIAEALSEVDISPSEHDVVPTSESAAAVKGLSKRAAKRQKREAKEANAGKQPAEKLQLVGSNDWYKNDKDEVTMIDAPVLEQVDEAAKPAASNQKGSKAPKAASKGATAPTKRPQKKKNGLKSDNQSSKRTDPQKAKADRAQLIASLTKEMMEDVLGPQVSVNEFANEEGDAKDREPVFFSSGGATAVARVTRPGVTDSTADAPSDNAAKGKSKTKYPANLTKTQKRNLARELNKKKQIEQNKIKKAAKEAAAAKAINHKSTEQDDQKELAQTNSFQEMARKAKEAVKAAQVVVEKKAAKNDKPKKGASVEEASASNAKDVPAGDSEGKKRRRKRNNNKLAEEDVEIGGTQRPLQPAAPNEQKSAGEPTQKSRRRPRAQKIAALLGQDVDAA